MAMRFRVASILSLLWSLPIAAVNTPQYGVPYFAAAASTLSPDSVRRSDAVGGGYQLMLGYPLGSGHEAVEVRLIDHEMRRQLDNSSNYQTSVFADYIYDFGTSVKGTGGFFSGSKLFLFAGIGLIEEDSYGEKNIFYGPDAGAGALIPLGFKGWAIRVEGRVQGQINKDTCDQAAVQANQCEDEASFLIDYMLAAGLQIPLTIFFDRPPPVKPAKDCPLGVVDPASVRRDCATDSDHDGVPDGSDQCPGSAMGREVNSAGCAKD